jgi:hypothetical protein
MTKTLNQIFFSSTKIRIFLENLNLLFINLLSMIQFYIPWEGEGGYDENTCGFRVEDF